MGHSDLRFAALITFAHLVDSAWMKALNSFGELVIGTVPMLASTWATFGEATLRTISWCSRSMISRGAPAGTRMPYHWVTSYPGTVSLIVGCSGRLRFKSGGGKCAQLSRLQMRHYRRAGPEHHGGLAREGCHSCRAGALVGHMHQLHLHRNIEQLACQVRCAEVSAGGIGEFAGALARQPDKIGHRSYRQRRMHSEDVVGRRNQRDRIEVTLCVLRHLARGRQHYKGNHVTHQQRVAVGRRLRCDLDADHPAGATTRIYQHRLPELVVQ